MRLGLALRSDFWTDCSLRQLQVVKPKFSRKNCYFQISHFLGVELSNRLKTVTSWTMFVCSYFGISSLSSLFVLTARALQSHLWYCMSKTFAFFLLFLSFIHIVI